MASKKKPNTRADQVRSAVDDAFAAAAGQAQFTRDRAQEIVDELSGAAGRLRDVLDDLRPPTGDELKALRDEVTALRREVKTLGDRVAKLEKAPRKPAARRSTSAKKS